MAAAGPDGDDGRPPQPASPSGRHDPLLKRLNDDDAAAALAAITQLRDLGFERVHVGNYEAVLSARLRRRGSGSSSARGSPRASSFRAACLRCAEAAEEAARLREQLQQAEDELRQARAPTAPAAPSAAGGQGESPSQKKARVRHEASVDQKSAVRSVEKTARWQQGELLGQGGFGTVHLALNMDTGELMAVKKIWFDAKDPGVRKKVQALMDEIRIMKPLNHPHVVKYFFTEKKGTDVLIFMEYVAGGSIHKLITNFGKLCEATSVVYTFQLLVGLTFLHSSGVLHRDIKCGNLLLGVDGSVKLADFGASVQEDMAADAKKKAEARKLSLKGTPCWMAPEVVTQSGHGWQADIWSLGCTVLEMLTGDHPWAHLHLNQIETLTMIADGDPPSESCDVVLPDGLSYASQMFLSDCLRRDPDQRPTAQELIEHHYFLEDAEEIIHRERGEPAAAALLDEDGARELAAAVPDALADAAEVRSESPGDSPRAAPPASPDVTMPRLPTLPQPEHPARATPQATPQGTPAATPPEPRPICEAPADYKFPYSGNLAGAGAAQSGRGLLGAPAPAAGSGRLGGAAGLPRPGSLQRLATVGIVVTPTPRSGPRPSVLPTHRDVMQRLSTADGRAVPVFTLRSDTESSLVDQSQDSAGADARAGARAAVPALSIPATAAAPSPRGSGRFLTVASPMGGAHTPSFHSPRGAFGRLRRSRGSASVPASPADPAAVPAAGPAGAAAPAAGVSPPQAPILLISPAEQRLAAPAGSPAHPLPAGPGEHRAHSLLPAGGTGDEGVRSFLDQQRRKSAQMVSDVKQSAHRHSPGSPSAPPGPRPGDGPRAKAWGSPAPAPAG